MQLSNNALAVLNKRYLVKDANGNPAEKPEDMFRRVANNIAQGEARFGQDPAAYEDKFYEIMTNLEFLPNSPTLMNAGRELQQLSACFVLPIPDSMDAIFNAVRDAALIHKSGGGTGFSFSRLRAKGSTVRSTGGVASGPISFMKVFNAATEAVKQGGTRRGANMGILRVDHPDVMEFIQCKTNTTEITNFNLSVAITEKFMEAVKAGTDYDLIDPHTGNVVGRQSAKEVWDLIVRQAWQNGEPGIVFIDRMNDDNPTKSLGLIESTNPCGEQPLLPYESCNLGSINLIKMLKEENGKKVVDYDHLADVTRLAVRFLDDVIEMNEYPIPEIDVTTKSNRKVGLGVMGFADMLMEMEISYCSEEAVKLAEDVMKAVRDVAFDYSVELGKERGSFPNFENSIYAGTVPALRNATLTTIAPTGTISMIAGVSSGIEPLFNMCYMRNVMDNDHLLEVHPIFERVTKERGIYTQRLMEDIAAEGTIAHMDAVPDDLKAYFVTAHDVSPFWHVKMQAAFQKYTHNAVSKTVNFKNSATIEDVEQVYTLAYQLGCKGVTIYRDGSRDAQVLNLIKKETPKRVDINQGIQPRPRPELVIGITEKAKMGCGNLYITVNMDELGIVEVFTNLGKGGGCPSQSEATGRLVSLALRSGISAKSVIEQLKGIRCHSTLRRPGVKVLSCPDAIATVLQKAVDRWQEIYGTDKEPIMHERVVSAPAVEVKEEVKEAKVGGATCPECGGSLEHEGGCVICYACGYSKCG